MATHRSDRTAKDAFSKLQLAGLIDIWIVQRSLSYEIQSLQQTCSAVMADSYSAKRLEVDLLYLELNRPDRLYAYNAGPGRQEKGGPDLNDADPHETGHKETMDRGWNRIAAKCLAILGRIKADLLKDHCKLRSLLVGRSVQKWEDAISKAICTELGCPDSKADALPKEQALAELQRFVEEVPHASVLRTAIHTMANRAARENGTDWPRIMGALHDDDEALNVISKFKSVLLELKPEEDDSETLDHVLDSPLKGAWSFAENRSARILTSLGSRYFRRRLDGHLEHLNVARRRLSEVVNHERRSGAFLSLRRFATSHLDLFGYAGSTYCLRDMICLATEFRLDPPFKKMPRVLHNSGGQVMEPSAEDMQLPKTETGSGESSRERRVISVHGSTLPQIRTGFSSLGRDIASIVLASCGVEFDQTRVDLDYSKHGPIRDLIVRTNDLFADLVEDFRLPAVDATHTFNSALMADLWSLLRYGPAHLFHLGTSSTCHSRFLSQAVFDEHGQPSWSRVVAVTTRSSAPEFRFAKQAEFPLDFVRDAMALTLARKMFSDRQPGDVCSDQSADLVAAFQLRAEYGLRDTYAGGRLFGSAEALNRFVARVYADCESALKRSEFLSCAKLYRRKILGVVRTPRNSFATAQHFSPRLLATIEKVSPKLLPFFDSTRGPRDAMGLAWRFLWKVIEDANQNKHAMQRLLSDVAAELEPFAAVEFLAREDYVASTLGRQELLDICFRKSQGDDVASVGAAGAKGGGKGSLVRMPEQARDTYLKQDFGYLTYQGKKRWGEFKTLRFEDFDDFPSYDVPLPKGERSLPGSLTDRLFVMELHCFSQDRSRSRPNILGSQEKGESPICGHGPLLGHFDYWTIKEKSHGIVAAELRPRPSTLWEIPSYVERKTVYPIKLNEELNRPLAFSFLTLKNRALRPIFSTFLIDGVAPEIVDSFGAILMSHGPEDFVLVIDSINCELEQLKKFDKSIRYLGNHPMVDRFETCFTEEFLKVPGVEDRFEFDVRLRPGRGSEIVAKSFPDNVPITQIYGQFDFAIRFDASKHASLWQFREMLLGLEGWDKMHTSVMMGRLADG